MLADANVQSINLIRTFPWLRLGRALGCALAPTQLILAFVPVLLFSLMVNTTRKLDSVPHVPPLRWSPLVTAPVNVFRSGGIPPESAPPLFHVFPTPGQRVGDDSIHWWLVVHGLAMYLAWTIFGVAICRCTAVQFCRETGPSFRQSMQWSLRRSASSSGSLLTPLGFAGVLAVILILLTLPAIFPPLAKVWLWIAAPLLTLLGWALLLMLVLLLLLWPLMVAAIAVDDSDAFDAFSRSFSLVTSRPWSMGLLCLVCVLAATLVGLVIQFLIVNIPYGLWKLSFGNDVSRLALYDSAIWWSRLFAETLLSSLFWSHATLIYLLLRQEVDGTPLDTLAAYEDDMVFREPYPVVGMPAVVPPASAPEP